MYYYAQSVQAEGTHTTWPLERVFWLSLCNMQHLGIRNIHQPGSSSRSVRRPSCGEMSTIHISEDVPPSNPIGNHGVHLMLLRAPNFTAGLQSSFGDHGRRNLKAGPWAVYMGGIHWMMTTEGNHITITDHFRKS